MAESTVDRDRTVATDQRASLTLRRCVVPIGAVLGVIIGVLTALSAWALAGLDVDETVIGTMLGAIMGAGLGTAAGLVASVLVDPRELERLCGYCRRPIGGGDCPDCGCDEHRTSSEPRPTSDVDHAS
jgi:hypothetical protein